MNKFKISLLEKVWFLNDKDKCNALVGPSGNSL